MFKIDPKYRTGLIGSLLILLTLAVFYPVGSYEFICYDDGGYVSDPHVVSGLTIANIAWAFRTNAMANWHPLTWLSYMLDWQLFGVNAGYSHLMNLLFHLLNVLLLFLLWNRMSGAVWQSAFVAALFAWHPLHVESVAWVAERKDVLSTFFGMLTLLAYVSYVQRPGAGRYGLALLFYALGLMAKPMLVTLPLILLLLDFWPLRRLAEDGPLSPALAPNGGEGEGSAQFVGLLQRPSGRRTLLTSVPTILKLLAEKIPFLVLAVCSSVLTLLAQQSFGAVRGVRELPISIRVANACLSCLNYLGKTLWPGSLAVPYPYPRGLYLGT